MSKVRRIVPLLAAAAVLLVPSAAVAGTLRAPALESPAAGARVESAPALTWKAVKGAARYEYQLASDSEFGSVVLGSGAGRGSGATRNTAAALAKPVPDGPYFWRVRAVDAKDRAGRWSAVRSYTQAWTTAPVLKGPAEAAPIAWPTTPLILTWSTVPYASKYVVTIATDPALTSPVIGTVTRPLVTNGTTFAFPGTLAPGSYYWAITPLDADGHKGQRSSVGSFTWSWLNTTTTTVVDANPAPSVYDPLFSWTQVPGAASYDVEVNSSHDWAPGSKLCCTDHTIGTSLSPTKPIENNVYYWRVRPLDASGNAGAWTEGASFQKDFDPAVPSIPNLRIRDNAGALPDAPSTATPIVTWDPVPGASSYTVQTTPFQSGVCDWSGQIWTNTPSPPPNWNWFDDTAAVNWTYLWDVPPLTPLAPGPLPGKSRVHVGPALSDGSAYCVRVRARSDRLGGDDNGFISDWTQIGGLGNPAFTYVDPPPVGGVAPVPFATPAGAYLTPQSGSVNERLPLFTWDPVPGASGYWVVVSRDATFTTIVDYAFTRRTNYAPGSGPGLVTYRDETTHYYWAVIPATSTSGEGASTVPAENAPQLFDKRSAPPALVAPAAEADVASQPTFRWTTSEGARKYQLQVSQDPTFGDPIDDVTTSSTAYTSSTTYPADTRLHWRVGGIDENGVRLDWSSTGTFLRRLPLSAPAPGNPTGGDSIPALGWLPVPGAVSYDIHADHVDGKTSDFTVFSTAFTPTEFYGNGIWRWKVRANFPTSNSGTVSGGYFAAQQFVRTVGRTPNVRASHTGSRVLIAWDPDPAAETYTVEVSQSSGFGHASQSTTKTTSFAPDLDSAPYADGGTLYWRVSSVDAGNNSGPAATGRFALPKAMNARVSGALSRGARSVVTVRVEDAKGLPVRGAKVRVTARGLRSASHRTTRAGTAAFNLRPRHSGVVTFTVTRRGYRDAVVTAAVAPAMPRSP